VIIDLLQVKDTLLCHFLTMSLESVLGKRKNSYRKQQNNDINEKI